MDISAVMTSPTTEIQTDITQESLNDTTSAAYVYITDHRSAQQRLATLAKHPDRNNKQIKIWEVAKRGFFFIGHRKQLKCYSCGAILEDWISSKQENTCFHNDDCEHVYEKDYHDDIDKALSRIRSSYGQCPKQEKVTGEFEQTVDDSLLDINPADRRKDDGDHSAAVVSCSENDVGLGNDVNQAVDGVPEADNATSESNVILEVQEPKKKRRKASVKDDTRAGTEKENVSSSNVPASTMGQI